MTSSDAAVQCYIDGLLLSPADCDDLSSPAVVRSLHPVSSEPVSDKHSPDSSLGSSFDESDAVSRGRPPKDDRVVRLASPFLRQLDVLQRHGAVASATDSTDLRPAWGREDFRCLSFHVAGLQLALPLSFVEAIAPLSGLVPAGVADAAAEISVLGEIAVGEEQALRKVVDTAKLVMPERYEESLRDRYRSILILRGCDWCFAVDSIGDEMALSPQGVRWRSQHTRRAWLAGTVVDKKCALLDVDALDRQLMADWVLSDWD